MSTTIKSLTDGVAAKDAVAVDQLGAFVTSVTAGPGISITGTPPAPIINNTGVLSVTAAANGGNLISGTAANPIVNSTQASATFHYSLGTSATAPDPSGLYAGNFNLAPAIDDGSGVAGVVYFRGFPFTGVHPTARAYIRAIAQQAGAFTAATDTRNYRFEITVTDGATGVLTATGIFVNLITNFAWVFPQPQNVSASGALVVNPGDIVGCQLTGSTTGGGAPTTATVFAFASISIGPSFH
jgi:hypothetical protein